jgi:hypothetical protein
MLPNAMVLANLLNFEIPVGAVRVDSEDGAVMVHHAFFVSDGTLGPSQVAANYSSVVNDAVRLSDAFRQLSTGNVTVEGAYTSLDDNL